MSKKCYIGEMYDGVEVRVDLPGGGVFHITWDHNETHEYFLKTLFERLGFEVKYEEVY